MTKFEQERDEAAMQFGMTRKNTKSTREAFERGADWARERDLEIIKRLREALEEIGEVTFGPHEKPNATIFKVIRIVKATIGLKMPKVLEQALEEARGSDG